MSNSEQQSVNPIPKGFASITPHIFIKDSAAAAIEFYKKVFDATEEYRMTLPEGDKDAGKIVHAVLNIGGSKLMMADEFQEMCGEHVASGQKIGAPPSIGGNSVFFQLYFENVNKVFDRAQQEGAIVTMPLMDVFWGDRYGQFKDPFVHIWAVATHKKDMSKEELEKAAKEAFKDMGKTV